MQICSNIRQLRLSRGFTAQEMASKLGVSRTTYNNWEKETEPDLTTIKSLSDIFGVHYVQIIDGIAADLKPVYINLEKKGQQLGPPLLQTDGAIQELYQTVKRIEQKINQVFPEGTGNLFDVVQRAIADKDSGSKKGK